MASSTQGSPTPLTEEAIADLAARMGAYYKAGPHFVEITSDDVHRYASSNGDRNPLYYDEEYARSTRYGGNIRPQNFLSFV